MDWNSISEEYLSVAEQVFGELRETIERVGEKTAGSLAAGNKIMICGNGGSAADSQHMAAELVNRFKKERRPYAAIALTTDASILTSISNDYSYDNVFEKQVGALAVKGDVLLGISTSGNAGNVCLAVEYAKSIGVYTVALTGGTGGKLINAADTAICLSCTTCTARIQEGHGLIIHALCEYIEDSLN